MGSANLGSCLKKSNASVWPVFGVVQYSLYLDVLIKGDTDIFFYFYLSGYVL